MSAYSVEEILPDGPTTPWPPTTPGTYRVSPPFSRKPRTWEVRDLNGALFARREDETFWRPLAHCLALWNAPRTVPRQT